MPIETSKPTGIGLIANERQRQLTQKTWTLQHDRREHEEEELADVARDVLWRKYDRWEIVAKNGGRYPTRAERIRQLTIAGALIAAELDLQLHAMEADDAG